MKKYVAFIMVIILTIIPICGCKKAEESGKINTAQTVSESDVSRLKSVDLSTETNFTNIEEIKSIVKDALGRADDITLKIENTADLEIDKTKTIPRKEDYCLITDSSLVACTSLSELMSLIESAYSRNYAAEHIYSKYLEDTEIYTEYKGGLYLNTTKISSIPEKSTKINYDTFYIINAYREYGDITVENDGGYERNIHRDYSEITVKYDEEYSSGEWSNTTFLRLIKEDKDWQIDNIDKLVYADCKSDLMKNISLNDDVPEALGNETESGISEQKEKALEIMDSFFARAANISMNFESAGDIIIDESKTIPNYPDYCLIIDKEFNDIHSMNELKCFIKSAYSSRYAEKYMYPKMYNEDGNVIFREYDGHLYRLKGQNNTVPGDISEIANETFYIIYQSGKKLIVKYDNESSDGSEWYDSCVCTMIKQNGAWVLDNMDLLMNNGNSVDYIKDTF